MKDPRDVILKPVVSEKSYSAIEGGVYTFIVHGDASKPEIRDAVQKIFDVKVIKVNTLWREGKQKRTRGIVGQRRTVKRAIVTLAPGHEIEIFQAG